MANPQLQLGIAIVDRNASLVYKTIMEGGANPDTHVFKYAFAFAVDGLKHWIVAREARHDGDGDGGGAVGSYGPLVHRQHLHRPLHPTTSLWPWAASGSRPRAWPTLTRAATALVMAVVSCSFDNLAKIADHTDFFRHPSHRHTQIIEVLLADPINVDPNMADLASGMTPCHIACDLGNPHAVTVLLAHGADPNITCKNGWTSCMYAAYSGSVACLVALNEGMLARKGQTLVVNAMATGHQRFFAHHNPRRRVDEGMTALDIAVHGGDFWRHGGTTFEGDFVGNKPSGDGAGADAAATYLREKLGALTREEVRASSLEAFDTTKLGRKLPEGLARDLRAYLPAGAPRVLLDRIARDQPTRWESLKNAVGLGDDAFNAYRKAKAREKATKRMVTVRAAALESARAAARGEKKAPNPLRAARPAPTLSPRERHARAAERRRRVAASRRGTAPPVAKRTPGKLGNLESGYGLGMGGGRRRRRSKRSRRKKRRRRKKSRRKRRRRMTRRKLR